MNAVPKPGEFYRHFKNRMYQIIAVANHSETGEKMVVYQALYGDFSVWVRPLPMFMEEVDRGKYPDAGQRYRFERVIPGQADAEPGVDKERACRKGDSGLSVPEAGAQAEEDEFDIILLDPEEEESSEEEEPGEAAVSPLLLEFLDTESFEDRMAILQRMKGKAGQREVDSLCLCLDVKPTKGTIEEQLEDLKQYLRMQQRYDASRLRRR